MSEPLAFQKADDLIKFASMTGIPPRDLELILTVPEAFEALDYLMTGGFILEEYLPVLQQDVELAKRQGDPWRVLDAFTIKGFRAVRADVVLN